MSRKVEAEAAARALNSAAIHLLRGLRPTDRRSGLTSARLSALSVLVFSGPTTLGRLAAAEQVSSPTMTRIVDGLVQLGLAERSPHPDGGRLVRISATVAGRSLMEAARDRRIATIVSAVHTLPAADQRRVLAAAPAFLRLADRVLATARNQGTGEGAAPRE